jgi:hypothetical protein
MYLEEYVAQCYVGVMSLSRFIYTFPLCSVQIAVVDISSSPGTGTHSILEGDPSLFFASVHRADQIDDASVGAATDEPTQDAVPTVDAVPGLNESDPAVETPSVEQPAATGDDGADSTAAPSGAVDVQPQGLHKNIVNVAMPTNNSAGFRSAVESVVKALDQFQPQLILLSIGFDGHEVSTVSFLY